MLPELAIVASLTLLIMSIAVYLRARQLERQLRRQERRVVEHAQDQALEIISAAQVEAEGDKMDLESSLKKISADQLREFKKALANISNSLQNDTRVQLKEFEQVLAGELDNYRQRKLAEMGRKVAEIVPAVVRRVAGRLVDQKRQQELIMAALEEAKKQHVL